MRLIRQYKLIGLRLLFYQFDDPVQRIRQGEGKRRIVGKNKPKSKTSRKELERLTLRNKDELAQKEGKPLAKYTIRDEVVRDRFEQSQAGNTGAGSDVSKEQGETRRDSRRVLQPPLRCVIYIHALVESFTEHRSAFQRKCLLVLYVFSHISNAPFYSSRRNVFILEYDRHFVW